MEEKKEKQLGKTVTTDGNITERNEINAGENGVAKLVAKENTVAEESLEAVQTEESNAEMLNNPTSTADKNEVGKSSFSENDILKNEIGNGNPAADENGVGESCTCRQHRMKSWALWVSVLGLLGMILQNTGVFAKIGLNNETWEMIITLVGSILTAFGIVNNPTEKKKL